MMADDWLRHAEITTVRRAQVLLHRYGELRLSAQEDEAVRLTIRRLDALAMRLERSSLEREEENER
jgi:hypothetical protein